MKVQTKQTGLLMIGILLVAWGVNLFWPQPSPTPPPQPQPAKTECSSAQRVEIYRAGERVPHCFAPNPALQKENHDFRDVHLKRVVRVCSWGTRALVSYSSNRDPEKKREGASGGANILLDQDECRTVRSVLSTPHMALTSLWINPKLVHPPLKQRPQTIESRTCKDHTVSLEDVDGGKHCFAGYGSLLDIETRISELCFTGETGVTITTHSSSYMILNGFSLSIHQPNVCLNVKEAFESFTISSLLIRSMQIYHPIEDL